MPNWGRQLFFAIFVLIGSGLSAFAQPGAATIKGQVLDQTGSAIPGATATVAGKAGFTRSVSSMEDGAFAVMGLAPGSYTVTVVANGFSPARPQIVTLGAGRTQSLSFPLAIATAKQEVTVEAESVGTVSVDPTQNAGSLVLKQEDLDALPDDPDELEEDLQALAGPSAGPSGGQIYIDGFTGGRLPPKESIREIRINQNPFSSEYDRLGFGRIEILTKPGSDKLRGQAFFNDSDGIFNSRNPYVTNKPDFSTRMFGGNIGGPLGKRASFFLDFDRRNIDDNAAIHATYLDPNTLALTSVNEAVLVPQRRTDFSPRIDYQISTNNTLVARYSYLQGSVTNAGVGTYDLTSRATNADNSEQSVQITETAVLGAKTVNETRFRYERNRDTTTAVTNAPTLRVLDAFTSGGAGVGHTVANTGYYEVQNYTSVTQGTHAMKFGVRLRTNRIDNTSPSNFLGTYSFASLAEYRQTLLLQQQGYSFPDIRNMGGGPSQFSISAGNPNVSLNQTDVGVYAQDDWRLKPNFTLSLGLRYETQTHIHDWSDIAPRLGFAWAPGSNGQKPGKTVFRGGWGIFYDRFSSGLTLNTLRYNGINQQQYIINNPDFYGGTPDLTGAVALPQTIRQRDANLRAPYTLQTALGIERQLPGRTTLSINYTNSHGVHLFRARNINAPIPSTVVPNQPNSGVRPYAGGNIYQYESDGILNQNQLMFNARNQLNRSVSLFAFYVLGSAHSNTDGAGSFPANQYDLSTEYGRASFDVRHRAFLGGSVTTKWNVRLSPFISYRSGSPFNVTTGTDPYDTSLLNVERPSLADPSLCGQAVAGIVCTQYGAFNIRPGLNDRLIPRNYLMGPSNFSFNLRASRTWGFGENTTSARGGASAPAGPGFGGPMGGRGGGRGGPGGLFGDASTNQRYNLTLSVSARNLFNTVNPTNPVGNLSSPFFGQSISLASNGPGGSAANNRRIELQLRFSF